MSHSSLSAQLASLHSKNGVSSRQNSDAMGRGIHHSSRVGHTILNNSVKHKPSVLYPDSKSAAAADIPFTTLRENGLASLLYLSQNCSQLFDVAGQNLPWKTLFGPKSIKYERGLNSKETNAKFDGFVKEALYLLSTAWGDSVNAINIPSSAFIQLGANKPSSVLHALEYLVQKYYIHVHNAETLLVSFLPHHETFLFDRILQLIDLAQYPHWSFLRPFSAARGISGVPRTTIAKWAASTKDNGGGTAILERICETAKRAAKIHSRERKLGVMGNDSRRGVSLCISFAAATLAEAIYIQNSSTGSVDEATLRCIIPIVFNAVEPLHEKKSSRKSASSWSLGALCPEWRSFGRIMISLLTEKCEMNEELNLALTNALVKGCVESIQLVRCDEMEVKGEEFVRTAQVNDYDLDEMLSTSRQLILEITSDAILTIMAITENIGNAKKGKETHDVQSFLPAIDANNSKHIIGCNFTTGIFHAMLKIPFLAISIGNLFVVREIDVRPLLASFSAMSISNMACKHKDYQNNISLILQLVLEPSLQGTWSEKDMNLLASISSLIVESVAKFEQRDPEMKDVVLTSLSKLLSLLKSFDSTSCDVGITRAITMISSLPEGGQKVERVQKLLHLSGHLKSGTDKKCSSSKGVRSGGENDKIEGNQLDHLLPPMMALEHPNANLRLQAITHLETEASNESDVNDIASALLRRYVSDDDVEVARKSSDALQSLHKKEILPGSFFIQPRIAKEIAFGLNKWTMFSEQASMSNRVIECLSSSLNLTSLAVRVITNSNDQQIIEYNESPSDEIIYGKAAMMLVIGISGHALHFLEGTDESPDTTLAELALQSLLHIFGGDIDVSQRKDSFGTICANKKFQSMITECMESHKSLERYQQLLWFFLSACNKIPNTHKESRDIQSLVVTTVTFFMAKYKENTKEDAVFIKEAACICQSLDRYVSFDSMESSVELVIELSSIDSNTAFEKISTHMINRIVNHWKKESQSSSYFVLLEAISCPTIRSVGIKRLMLLIDEHISSSDKIDDQSSRFIIMTMLSLCGNYELETRKSAMKLFNKVGKALPKKDTKSQAIRLTCSSNTSIEANILMDGANALPQLLLSIAKKSEGEKCVSEFLLDSCNNMALRGLDLILSSKNYNGDGFCHAASVLLSAMETAGENDFSLLQRWERVGENVFDYFLKKWSHTKPLSPAVKNLLECITVMIKGVTVGHNHNQGIVITSQVTGSGRRTRSYSVGMSEGISYIHPYPTGMTIATTDFLALVSGKEMNSFLLEFSDAMMNLVVLRTSWVNGVFLKMDKSIRKNISTALLNLRSKSNIESAGLALMGLNLGVPEIKHLLKSKESKASGVDSVGLLALTVVTECISQQANHLVNDSHVDDLIMMLFERLSVLSTKNSFEMDDDCDYTRCCLIQSLLSLTKDLKSGASSDVTKFNDYAKLLVALLQDNNTESDIKPLLSSKSKHLALQLLTHLCALSPSTIVGSLVPAMINTMMTSSDSVQLSASESAMMAIIPTYCRHASSAGLSLMDLLNAFIGHCRNDNGTTWGQMLRLYTQLTKGLLSYEGSDNLALATVLTVYLASEASSESRKSNNEETSETEEINETPMTFTSKLLGQVEVHGQIGCSLQMLLYVSNILSSLVGEQVEPDDADANDFFRLSTQEISSFALSSQNLSNDSQKEDMPLIWLVITILEVLQKNIFSQPLVRGSIRNCDDALARVCLKIWQELTVMQSHLAHYKYQDRKEGRSKFWVTVGGEIGSILSTVQRMLPTPHFLASVSSLLHESVPRVDLQKCAIQLLAERSGEVDGSSYEAMLFLEMMPDLVNLCKGSKKKSTSVKDNNLCILRQTSFRAIEEVTKNLGLGTMDEKTRRKRSTVFLPALQVVANFLRYEISRTDFSKIGDDSVDDSQTSFYVEAQVLSSALLCAAALITMLEARCIAQLQSIVKPSLSMLCSANKCLSQNEIEIGGSNHQSLKLIQLSIIRMLVALAETLPKFLTPFLETLLAPTCLPSINIKHDTSDEGIAVQTMTERLENAMATRSPVHQLIPILSKAIRKCLSYGKANGRWERALPILKILNLSISQSSRSDLSPAAGKILNALAHAYSHDCDEGRSLLLNGANETLLSLVMKLSESQLRPLYSRLREWRGEFVTSSDNRSLTRKRFAFWSLSAAVCQKLRNLFLPCLSIVVGDIVKELEYAASCLCTPSKAKGNKRQKIQDNSFAFDVEILSPLQPLLLCLESALKADAHEGGNWIRSEDGRRYRMLLDPLGKLLQATVPQDLAIEYDESSQRSSASAYEMLIQGVGTQEQGNVSQTLTALAAAAGNEQLWKPLNYSLLEACGNERRIDVRKAGVKSLLNIIQTLGEEYMVLLPECLPVLSELLEDEDESIISLAKECVQQGEELLGESLEDSLR